MLKHRIFVPWSVSPVAKLAILFSTIQLHPCPQHQSSWRTLSCFQVYFFLVRLPVAVGLDDEYPLSFLIHCRQHLRHDRKKYPDQLTSNGYHCLSAFQWILYPFSVIIIDRSEFFIALYQW